MVHGPPGSLTRQEFGQRTLATGASVGGLGALLAACGRFTSEYADPTAEEATDRWNDESPDIQMQFESFPFEDYTSATLTTVFPGGRGPGVEPHLASYDGAPLKLEG